MSDNTEQNEPCRAEIIVTSIAYVVAFAVPAVVVAVAFPEYAGWSVFVAGSFCSVLRRSVLGGLGTPPLGRPIRDG